MATQDYILKTFIVYLFVKALVFFPLAWMAFLVWWNERSEPQSQTPSEA
jgi:hypothetical protein